jgi:hypothetical protein
VRSIKNHQPATEPLRRFGTMLDMRLLEYRPLVRAMRVFEMFCVVQPRERKFGEWYFTTGEVRRVPIELALPRRLIRRSSRSAVLPNDLLALRQQRNQ